MRRKQFLWNNVKVTLILVWLELEIAGQIRKTANKWSIKPQFVLKTVIKYSWV